MIQMTGQLYNIVCIRIAFVDTLERERMKIKTLKSAIYVEIECTKGFGAQFP